MYVQTVFMILYPNLRTCGVPISVTLSVLLFTCWCVCVSTLRTTEQLYVKFVIRKFCGSCQAVSVFI